MSAKNRIFKEIAGVNGEKIVLLNWDGQPPKFINMQKIDSSGAVLWTATPDHPLESVWASVQLENGNIRAYNCAGFIDLIDYGTGRILHREFTK